MRVLLDTNIVLRLANPASEAHLELQQCVRTLISRGDTIFLVPQCIYEAWSTMTRPLAANGFAFATQQATAEVAQLLQRFPLLLDPPDLFQTWLNLVTTHEVSGRPTHDARLAAAVIVHGLDALFTNNAGDFKRFNIQVLTPADI